MTRLGEVRARPCSINRPAPGAPFSIGIVNIGNGYSIKFSRTAIRVGSAARRGRINPGPAGAGIKPVLKNN